MAQLSDIAIAGYARSAGFNGTGLTMAIAVALAESGGDPNAQGQNRNGQGVVTSVDRGLWQINSVYHPEVSDQCAYNPGCAAGAAFNISQRGLNWRPWSTFINGSYKQYMSRASVAASGTGGNVVSPNQNTKGTAPSSTANSLTNVVPGTTLAVQGNPLFEQVSTSPDIKYQTLGSTTNQDVFTPYKIILALAIMFGFLYAISRTRAGYTAIYYGEVLILLFLFATQSTFFKESLLPLASKSPQGS